MWAYFLGALWGVEKEPIRDNAKPSNVSIRRLFAKLLNIWKRSHSTRKRDQMCYAKSKFGERCRPNFLHEQHFDYPPYNMCELYLSTMKTDSQEGQPVLATLRSVQKLGLRGFSYHSSGGASLASYRGAWGSVRGDFSWHSGWTKDTRFSPALFRAPLPIIITPPFTHTYSIITPWRISISAN